MSGTECEFDFEFLPPPCMASVTRPDFYVTSPMSATLVDANEQISRVEGLVSSLRTQVAAGGLRIRLQGEWLG